MSPSSRPCRRTSRRGREAAHGSPGARRRRAAGPDGAPGGDLGDVESVGGANGYRSGHRLDVEHVPRLAVGSRRADAQALALADGEGVGAFVLADDSAGGVHDLARRLA